MFVNLFPETSMEAKTKELPGHEADALPYCATCKNYLTTESVNDKLLGQRFLCPNWSHVRPHVAAIVKKAEEEARWWLRWQDRLAGYQKWSSDLFDKTRTPALLVQLLFLLLALVLASYPGHVRWLAGFLAALYVCHCLAYNTSVAFVTQLPKAPLRSAVLGLIAFVWLTLSFAVFYLLIPARDLHVERDFDIFTAIYFSIVTIVTLGYGDIRPNPGGYLAYSLVALEIFAGLYFLSTLFATMVGWASRRERLPTLTEILDDSGKLDDAERSAPPN